MPRVVKQPPKLEPIVEDNIIDVLIIPKVVGQLDKTLADVYSRLTRSSTIVLLHNGMGVLEEVQSYWSNDLRPNIVEGYSSHGIRKEEEFKVNHWGHGNIRLAIAPRLDEEDLFTSVGISNPSLPPVIDYRDVNRDLRLKALDEADKYRSLVFIIRELIRNATLKCNVRAYLPHFYIAQLRRTVAQSIIQVLSAVQRCTYKELMENGYSRGQIKQLISEIVPVLEADPLISSSQVYLHQFSSSELYRSVRRVAWAAPSHVSALRQDIEAKEQHELNRLPGYIIGLAKQRGFEVPLLKHLTSIVAALGTLEDKRSTNFAPVTKAGDVRDLPEWTYGIREQYWKVHRAEEKKIVRMPRDVTVDMTEDVNEGRNVSESAVVEGTPANTSARGSNYGHRVETSRPATDNNFSADRQSSINQRSDFVNRLRQASVKKPIEDDHEKAGRELKLRQGKSNPIQTNVVSSRSSNDTPKLELNDQAVHQTTSFPNTHLSHQNQTGQSYGNKEAVKAEVSVPNGPSSGFEK
jgi:2-dehydropantoate 2-reductase